jgi:hypothetical protein
MQWERRINIRFDGSAVMWRCKHGSAFKQRRWCQGKNITKFREKNTLFNCHFMRLNWPIFGIFPSLPASPSPGQYCHTNISLGSSGTHVQRTPQCLSFCFINWLSPLFSTRKGSARKPFSSNLPFSRVSDPAPLGLCEQISHFYLLW